MHRQAEVVANKIHTRQGFENRTKLPISVEYTSDCPFCNPKHSWDIKYESLQIFLFLFCNFFFLWRCDPAWVMPSSFLMFLDHTQRRTTLGRTSLDEWSARRRDLYLTTHNTHNRQISMPPVGFEHTISAGERPQTYALDRAATGIGCLENST